MYVTDNNIMLEKVLEELVPVHNHLHVHVCKTCAQWFMNPSKNV